MKMSKLFGVVSVCDTCIIDPEDNGTWLESCEKWTAEAAAHAINNHDKLVESLREVIDLSKSPREHKEARERASKLLAELENINA